MPRGPPLNGGCLYLCCWPGAACLRFSWSTIPWLLNQSWSILHYYRNFNFQLHSNALMEPALLPRFLQNLASTLPFARKLHDQCVISQIPAQTFWILNVWGDVLKFLISVRILIVQPIWSGGCRPRYRDHRSRACCKLPSGFTMAWKLETQEVCGQPYPATFF